MNTRITELRNLLERQKGKKQQLEKSLTDTQAELKQNQRSLKQHEQARELIRIAGETTQRGLSYHISEITSLALEAVFDSPYELTTTFVQRRNKTE